ncbi:hypothetical protein EF912_17230 [Streptomyces sp. WAC07061]|uniref:AfsA-related hotdog domain-containing protein n=1 Tax=Streptomyces sp. WAC07061 TaxID=2487410 RepID=UPI000F770547|nr:AfsA-related hotdog domain-containing protein [Streptomyces sp. WAC07061]RSS54428.1 hypothetical protein EF912_17230 [Streptomyces sp. WAC07061]
MDTAVIAAGPTATRAAARHLVHRPQPWDRHGGAAAPPVAQEFVLLGDLTSAHPLFDDGPAHFHDVVAAADMLREVGEFIGRTHFRVPGNRTGIFYRVGIESRDIGPWRTRPGSAPARLATTMSVRPDKVIDGVPRALEFRTALEIDDVPCGTGTANLVFLAPMVHRDHREHSRLAALSSVAGQDRPAAAVAPVDPEEVGRRDPANVLLHGPRGPRDGRLSVGVSVPPHWLGERAARDGHVPAPALLESLRQTSLLAVGRGHCLEPGRSALASLQVHVRGYAEADLPLRCAAVTGRPGRDAAGRRTAPLTLTLTQAGRTVLEATTVVVEDH